MDVWNTLGSRCTNVAGSLGMFGELCSVIVAFIVNVEKQVILPLHKLSFSQHCF